VHHKKGRLRAATSHESRPGKPSFCTFVVRTRPLVRAKTDNSSNTELGKLLGYYPNIQHEMLNRNAAQKRPGNKPSSPKAFQNPLRAQMPANGGTTSQLRLHRPGAMTAVEGSAGTKSTTYTSLIPGRPPSPSPLNLATHDVLPALQPAAPTTTGDAPHERRAQHAQYLSPEKGNEQADINGLQLGGESTPHAAVAQRALQSIQPNIKAKPSTQQMSTLA